MAAKHESRLADRAAVFIRDFSWRDLDYILGRLSRSQIVVPNQVVAERIGYLFPFHIGPNRRAVIVVPDMVEIPPYRISDPAGPFLHLATVNSFKGHTELMLALQMAVQSNPTIKVVSAGHIADATLFRHLMALRETLGLRDQFEFAGYCPDPTVLLDRCHAVVVPSISHSGGPETFGRAIIEGWAHRKPVIAFTAGAPARLISEGKDGLLVLEGDTEGLAAAMSRLWNEPRLSATLGEAGFKRAILSTRPHR